MGSAAMATEEGYVSFDCLLPRNGSDFMKGPCLLVLAMRWRRCPSQS